MKKVNKFLLYVLPFLIGGTISCSSENTTNNVSKSSLKDKSETKEHIVDLGYKNGGKIALNISFKNISNKFNIKADAILGEFSKIHHIKIVLSTTAPVPSTDFADSYNAPVNGGAVKVIGSGAGTVASTNTVLFQNLKPNTTYYVAARAFYDAVETINVTSIDGTPSGAGGGTAGPFNGETITVAPNGVITLNNDSTPPPGSGINNVWDLTMQLQASVGASTTGKISVVNGVDTPGPVGFYSIYDFITNNYHIEDYNGSQTNPDIAITDNNEAIIVWSGEGAGDSDGIYGQRHINDEKIKDNEFDINSTTPGIQGNPRISSDKINRFVVVWDGVSEIRGKLIHADTSLAFSSEFLIDSSSSPSKPALAMVSTGAGTGKFVVVWNGSNGVDTDGGIFARLYDFNGTTVTPVTSLFSVNTATTGLQQNPSVAMMADGSFIVVWEGQGIGDTYGIYFQQYNSAGTPLGPNRLVTFDSPNNDLEPSVSINSSGQGVIVWKTQNGANFDILAQKFNNNGTRRDRIIKVNDSVGQCMSPYVTLDDNGVFMVTWKYNSSFDITAKELYFSEKPEEADNEFVVNQWISPTANSVKARTAINNNGRMGFVWYDQVNSDIYFRGARKASYQAP